MTAGRELVCKELVELVTEYLEGTLSSTDRARFETHIAGCGPCHRYLEQMRLTIATLGRLSEADVPLDGMKVLLEAFRGWKAGRQ
jgi:hypothetical protein